MRVTVQKTPNPNALKFIFPEKIFDKPLSFPSVEQAQAHPLAAELFALGSVYNVFMVQDFVTVNKFPEVSWEEIENQLTQIMDSYRPGQPDLP